MIVVAGTHSGVGKTTVALALMAAARARGLTVQPFKVGPDFIDPQHHARVCGRPSSNLDGWLLPREVNLAIAGRRAAGAGLSVVEGVMGLFDGHDGRSDAGSTAEIAKWLGAPVLLVVDASALSRSAAALVHGFATYDPDLRVAGVVLNRVAGERHETWLREAIAPTGVPVVGALRGDAALALPERHLGLALDRPAPIAEGLDLDAILALAAPPPPAPDDPDPPAPTHRAAA